MDVFTWLVVQARSLALQLQIDKVSVKEQASAEHVWLELDDMGAAIFAGVPFLSFNSRSFALVSTLHKQFLSHKWHLTGVLADDWQHPGPWFVCTFAWVCRGKGGGEGG